MSPDKKILSDSLHKSGETMNNQERMKDTNTTQQKKQTPPQTVEEMVHLHDHTQKGWIKIEQGLQKAMTRLGERFGVVESDIEKLAGTIESELDNHDKRIAKNEQLHEKLAVKVDEIEHLDKQRDNNIENLQRQFNTLSQELRDEVKGIRDATEYNRKERREDIDKLETQIHKGFEKAESQRKEENWNSVKQNAALISTVLAIIVPILVALIYLTTSSHGG